MLLFIIVLLLLFDVVVSWCIEVCVLCYLFDLMECVGLVVVKLVLVLWCGDGLVWVVCGLGNNGSDGCVVVWCLVEVGVLVYVGYDVFECFVVIIDVLFGLGLNCVLLVEMFDIIVVMVVSGVFIFVVDLLSGLFVDIGMLVGECVVYVDYILMLLMIKFGFFIGEGWVYVGCIWFDDFGIVFDEVLMVNLFGFVLLFECIVISYKGSYG